MDSVKELVDVIHARGGKVTPQRLLIYQSMERNRDHPTADELHRLLRRKMPTMSLTTVYKTLNELVDIGQLKRFDVQGVSHFDPDTRPHAEAVCLRCDKIADVPSTVLDRIETVPNFNVWNAAVTLYGECSDCARLGHEEFDSGTPSRSETRSS